MINKQLPKWLILFITMTACLISAGFLKSEWDGYQARKQLNRLEKVVSEGKNAEAEIAELEESLPALESDSWSLQKFGSILEELGEKCKAIGIYEKARQADSSPDTLMKLSSLYLDAGRYDDSIAAARTALDILPWKLEPRFLLASAYLGKGEQQKAFEYCLDTILTPEKLLSRKGARLKKNARKLLPQCIPNEGSLSPDILRTLPNEDNIELINTLQEALYIAGKNRAELEKSLVSASEERFRHLLFLLSNMPEKDLRELNSDYLLKSIDSATAVWNIWPFMPEIPESVFLRYLLPYSQLGETRDSWREDLRDRCMPLVRDCKSAGEIVLSLQAALPIMLEVVFDHENVSDSYWSMGEILENKTANCVGLSILLANSCRAVGIPARVATIPRWTRVPGGHAWVEFWDQGQWRHISAFDPSPVDRTWFEERASKTDTSKFIHRIYAASFERTDIQLYEYGPNVWWHDITFNYVSESGNGSH